MRAGAGTTDSTTIELRRLDSATAAAIAVRTICANTAYKSTTVGEGVYQFTRVYRPKWATISGWVLTIGLLGAGYWLLLIKRTEACTMWVSEDRATVRVILAGGLLHDVHDLLCSAFDEVESTAAPSSDFNQSERGESDDLLPLRAFRSLPVVTPVGQHAIDLVALERDEIDRVEIDHRVPDRSPTQRRAPVLDLPEVQFETGEQVRVMGVVYVGRDPWHRDASGTSRGMACRRRSDRHGLEDALRDGREPGRTVGRGSLLHQRDGGRRRRGQRAAPQALGTHRSLGGREDLLR